LMRRARVTEMRSQAEGLHIRVEWDEVRKGQLYFVIGDKISDGWEFFDRSAWDQCYQPMEYCEELNVKADLVVQESLHTQVLPNILADLRAEAVPVWRRAEGVRSELRIGGLDYGRQQRTVSAADETCRGSSWIALVRPGLSEVQSRVWLGICCASLEYGPKKRSDSDRRSWMLLSL